MEFWSFTVQDHSNFINTPISIRDVDRKKAMLKPSSNSIQYRAQHGNLQDSQGITEETSLPLLPQEPQNWSLDNQFLSRKCMEMFGEQATVDQPAAEPDSYWGQVSRQLHPEKDQINDQANGLYLLILSFRPKQRSKRNFEGDANSWYSDSFRQLNGQSMLPVTPMTSVTTPSNHQ